MLRVIKKVSKCMAYRSDSRGSQKVDSCSRKAIQSATDKIAVFSGGQRHLMRSLQKQTRLCHTESILQNDFTSML